MMKMNEARKLNNKAVIEENERVNDPQYEKRKQKEEFSRGKKDLTQMLEAKGLTKDKAYVLESA